MDARKILLSDDKSQVLTQAAGGFAERAAELLQPLCNIVVYDANGNQLPVKYAKENLFIGLPSSESSPSSTGTVDYGGLWLSGTQAKYKQMWRVPVGSYAGTYICVNPNGTTQDPWTGTDWNLLSQTNAIGNW